jgi:replicative DNA helicase
VARAVDDVPRLRPDRVPPQNLEAEASVLGAMLLSAEAIADVVEILHPDDFYRSAHRKLFETMRGIYARGDPVDIITTTEELKRAGIVEEIGGPLYVRDLSEQVPTPAGAAHYARIVAQAALLRRLIDAAADIMQMGYSSPEDPETVADEAEQRIYEVARREDRDQVAQVRDLIDEAMMTLESIQNREAQYEGIPTGFRDLDSLMSGMQAGNLIVVAARPGVGKSSFVTNLARNVAVDAHAPVGLFSLEMSRWEIGMRLLCGEARVPWDRIRNKRVGAEDWSNIVQAAEKLHDAPLSIVDSGNVTIVDIRARARRLATRQQGLGVIVVDYLQLMSHHRRVDNRQQEIAEISRSLKLLAKELSIPVIAVSQLNRDPERRQDKRPQLSDLRECVTGETPVVLADGRLVPIRDLVGETPHVLAFAGGGRLVEARADLVWEVGRRPVFELRLASGRSLRATAEHRVYGAAGWRRLAEVGIGDALAVAGRTPEPAAAFAGSDARGWVPAGGVPRSNRHPGEARHPLAVADSSLVGDDGSVDGNEEVFWDAVIGVEPAGERTVFDMTVPGPANWLAEGIVTHNSGAIEQDADVVIFIHRDDTDVATKGTADLIVAKHRNGPTDTVKLAFLPSLTQFRNFAPAAGGPPPAS